MIYSVTFCFSRRTIIYISEILSKMKKYRKQVHLDSNITNHDYKVLPGKTGIISDIHKSYGTDFLYVYLFHAYISDSCFCK